MKTGIKFSHYVIATVTFAVAAGWYWWQAPSPEPTTVVLQPQTKAVQDEAVTAPTLSGPHIDASGKPVEKPAAVMVLDAGQRKATTERYQQLGQELQALGQQLNKVLDVPEQRQQIEQQYTALTAEYNQLALKLAVTQ
jgi:hypothetical protein